MAEFMAWWALISGILFLVGMIGFSFNKFSYYGDEDIATIFVFVAFGGLIWPILLPVALIAVLTLMVLQALISFKIMERPRWWE